ncbi:MFS transporter [Mycobacterium crocinum]|uniref:MFS transporter n=1 Tax=Mycolicibacterium crocinum TaxID=388459 RepID=A0ABY3TN12_9MYCO|nr:MFS transporter [Mycolicibacterium crocinum]MCV7213859.1 MFS transporter [Mycolicibacterium crocinum]ULN42628.1 MFS transporter [Mycolicibacterium crocinum]
MDTLIRPDKGTDTRLRDVSTRQRTWTLTVACLGVVLVISSMVALNTALGDIAVTTSATQSQLTWVVDSYTLVLACLLLPAGAIGDRYGRRGALMIGLAIFTLASLAPIVFDAPIQIIAARAIAGAGAAFVMPATLSLLTVVYPKSQRNKAVGIWAAVAGSGAVLGMLGTGVLLHFWPWQSIFWAFAGAGLALFVLTWTVSDSRDADAPAVDWPGAALIGGAVAVLVFGIVEAPQRGWADPLVIGCLCAGVALAVAFGVFEVRRRHPLLDVSLFRRADFATGAAAIAVFFLANFGFMYLVMQYTQLILGYSALQTAMALAPLTVPMAVLSVSASWYLPRLGLRVVVFTGLLFIAAGFACLLTLTVDSSYIGLAWPLLVLATGIGLCTAPTTSAIMNAAPDEKQGVASAVNDTVREVGAALGIALAGSILAGQYTHRLGDQLGAFPPPVRDAAGGSLAEALAVSTRLGPVGAQLADISKSAFLHAMQSSITVLSILVAIAAVLIGLWAPGRDGRQLRLVRNLTRRDEFGRPVSDHRDGRVGAAAGDAGKHRAVDHP